MTHIEHIPSTRAVVTPPKDARALGIGVLGLHEGRTLLAALDRCAFARPVAGCDADADKVAACRAAFPDVPIVERLDALLAMDEVDIVAVYTPDALHAEHAEAAFAADRHVIVTKPLANDLAGAARILGAGRAARDRCGARLLVGQSSRFFEPFLRQRRQIESGGHGGLDAVEMVDAHYVHRMDWYYRKSPWAASETDWVFLGLSHPVDLVRWYLGRIDEVHAYGMRSAVGRAFDVRGFDAYTVNLRAADGRVGRVMGHYGAHELPRARNAIELLVFAAGGTSLAQYHDMRYLRTGEGDEDMVEIVEDHLYAGRHYYFNSEVHGMHYGEFANYAEHFARAIIEGAESAPGLEEGVETVCVMEAIRQSAVEGRPVQLEGLLREVGLT